MTKERRDISISTSPGKQKSKRLPPGQRSIRRGRNAVPRNLDRRPYAPIRCLFCWRRGYLVRKRIQSYLTSAVDERQSQALGNLSKARSGTVGQSGTPVGRVGLPGRSRTLIGRTTQPMVTGSRCAEPSCAARAGECGYIDLQILPCCVDTKVGSEAKGPSRDIWILSAVQRASILFVSSGKD